MTINITPEMRAERIFNKFVESHEVPDEFEDDLREEIELALECFEGEPVRQSEMYDFIEEYLEQWMGDLVDSRRPNVADMISWGYYGPETVYQVNTGGNVHFQFNFF